jgi:hypothetical protein
MFETMGVSDGVTVPPPTSPATAAAAPPLGADVVGREGGVMANGSASLVGYGTSIVNAEIGADNPSAVGVSLSERQSGVVDL